ncbi:MAG: S41 family peptidase [Muribaculaceae bacterium]|nr:S41 family peptidase [Muribaculaceae bacterium]
MKQKKNIALVSLPFVLTAGMVAGIFIGKVMNTQRLSPAQEKFMSLLGLIDEEYVDEINVDSLLEEALPDLFAHLDPHSVYIPKSELTSVNQELDNSFSGVGISFQMLGDSVVVVEVVPGGPAEKVGIMAGDRIVSANGISLAGPEVTTDSVYRTLRGKEGTKALLKVKRQNSRKLLDFDVVRGKIPVNSVDAIYTAAPGVGYLRVGKFGTGTYDEFFNALNSLKSKGASRFIVDLRGNTGGYMDQAILMANEFLPRGSMIVYSKGRLPINESVGVADGNGAFQDAELVVLIDEYSASASEIFAGAIQDNDRGLVVGRRSFGKGLVQNQTLLPDSSAVRLTVARYFTPSGRCIQKEYKRGSDGKYEMDIVDRYNHGEFYNPDSIRLDKSKRFTTVGGRTVYGGGGIMPDIFVAQDTTGYTSYYINAVNSGLIQKFAFQVVEKYRPVLKGVKTLQQLNGVIPRDNTLLENFVAYAAANGLPARWYYINMSRDQLLSQIKSVIARDVLGYSDFIRSLNQSDPTVIKAVEALTEGKSPVVIKK